MNPRIAAAVLSVLCAAVPVGALDPGRELTQYSHRIWQDELPQNSVHTVVQSSDGYIWFGTYEGLVRFDGVRFVVFDASNTPNLPGSTVLHLYEDRSRRLWISTNRGLARLEAGRFESWSEADGLNDEFVNAVTENKHGTLWVATAGGLCRSAGDRFEAVAVPGVGPGQGIVVALEDDGAGGLWLGTTIGLLRFDGEALVHFNAADGMPETSVRALQRGRNGTLWVATDSGLVRFDGRDFEVLDRRRGLPTEGIRAVFEDRSGVLWIGTEQGGLVRYHDGRFAALDAADGLSHDYVRSITEDREGALWVGTNGGLNQLRDARFISYSTREGLGHEFARTVFEDSGGTLWIGSDGGGLDRWTEAGFENFSTADGLPNDSVRSLAEGPDGSLWIGTRGGVARLVHGRFETMSTSEGLSSQLVRVILVDSKGVVWIGTESGLNRIVDGEVEVLTTEHGLAGNDVRVLHEDRSGAMWVGTFGGATRIRDGVFDTFRAEHGLPSNIVFSFFEDPESGLWIGTEHGLALYRDPGFSVFMKEVGLFDDKYFSILADEVGSVWMSSNKGLARVELRQFRDLGAGRIRSIRSFSYDTADGMLTNQCNGASQPAAWKGANGHVWYPTTRGVVEVAPGDLRPNTVPPPVLIEEIVIGDERYEPGSRPLVPAGTERFEFHYTALSFAAPERVLFRFRLEGSDEQWMDVQRRRVAYFTHLPPGNYRFSVQACNEDGVWNEAGAFFSFAVAPALWQIWWVRLGAVALLLAATLFVFRIRTRSLARRAAHLERVVGERTREVAEKNTELSDKVRQLEVSERSAHRSERRAVEASRAKSVFLSNMSHELRTPLNSIIGFATILQTKSAADLDEKSRRFLQNIRGSGEHLLALINDILDLSKIEAGRMDLNIEPVDVAAVIEEVRRVMQGVSNRKDVELEIADASGVPRIMADRAKIKQILFNLMSNAVKFSEDGSRVEVGASLVERARSPLSTTSLMIEVVDEGIGIAAADQELIFEEFRQVDGSAGRQHEGTGLGLALVKHLVGMQGGVIELDSEPGRGSRFTVYLPQVVETH